MNGKSDLHLHFHGDVAAGATVHIHAPSINGGITKQDFIDLREALLSRRQLTQELGDAIELLSSKVQAVDDVVLDQPIPLNPTRAE